jgi:TIR domain
MATGISPAPGQQVFRIFISYASEDFAIATAIATCFKSALPDFFAEVNLDKDFLEPGSAFKTQIETKLQETNVLLIVYSGAGKQSHSYTGWEVGYFDHILRTDPAGRQKISLYLFDPPATTSSEQGIPIGLSTEQLKLTPAEFETRLSVSPEEALCKEIENWQKVVADNIEKMRFPRQHSRADQEPARCVHNLRLAIFQYLKGTIESVVKPQKQITIRLKGSAVEPSATTLPLDAEIRPLGSDVRPPGALTSGGSMSIFGLSDETITWGKFLDQTASQPFGESWRDAIATVILSAFPDRVDVDNRVVILASDGRMGYRVILTTATKFYDDYREYNLYFVEMLQRKDYGDQETTYLLKGLELACRFRSAFLEITSDFRGQNILLTQLETFPKQASELLKELNFLHRDAQEAGLDRPGIWTKYVGFEHLQAIANAYQPCELNLRSIIPRVLAAKGQPSLLEPIRMEMSGVLSTMEEAVRPENALLIKGMVAELTHLIAAQDKANAVGGPLS